MGAGGHLLTLDAGNSTLDWLRHDTGARGAFDIRSGLEEFVALVHAATPGRCVAVSTVESVRLDLQLVLGGRGVPVRFAGHELACPLPLEYRTPETLGADRWVGALAAHRAFGRSVVVDCGSATTVNLVEQDGTFRGGAIGPGLRALALGMAAATPALPVADFESMPSVPSASTQAAVDTGVVSGYCGLVERLVADTVRAAAGPVRIVVTGGNARRLLARSRLRATFFGDLVHTGLRLLDELP
ncbi:MAG: type III pantothenate kinase [Planctomycetes bacterium]|nr:type III pantothenate kinase [Planctomycetota bacterium]